MERSFAQDVKQLGYGAGQVLTGEGILAITKAILQSGVSYVGGYPGAPISHLLDVLAEANEPLLKPMGTHFEVSGSEAAAAALLGASINYPMRGVVTWKSVVGTNVASDPLSHVASAGVVGGALIVIGEDYGEGASILQERTHSAALKSSDPAAGSPEQLRVVRPLRRGGLRPLRGVQPAGLLLDPHPRLPHARHHGLQGQPAAEDQHGLAPRRAGVRPGPDQPAAVHLPDGGPEVRHAPAGRPALHPRAQAERAPPGDRGLDRYRHAGRALQHGAPRAVAPGRGRPLRRHADPPPDPERASTRWCRRS